MHGAAGSVGEGKRLTHCPPPQLLCCVLLHGSLRPGLPLAACLPYTTFLHKYLLQRLRRVLRLCMFTIGAADSMGLSDGEADKR